MGGSSRVLRALFGVLLLVGFIWFFFVGILANQARTTLIIPSDSIKHSKLTGRHRPAAYQDLDLNYVSKRRVPNGPDPIHNRRAGKSRQPPDRA